MLSVSVDDGLLLPGQVGAKPSNDTIANLDQTSTNDPLLDNFMNKHSAAYRVLLSTHIRSIFPTLHCLCATLSQECVRIGFITELWMDKCNPP